MKLKQSNEILLRFENNTDTLFEQTKTRSKENVEFKLTKSMDTFSFNAPWELEEKCLIAVTLLEFYISILK